MTAGRADRVGGRRLKRRGKPGWLDSGGRPRAGACSGVTVGRASGALPSQVRTLCCVRLWIRGARGIGSTGACGRSARSSRVGGPTEHVLPPIVPLVCVFMRVRAFSVAVVVLAIVALPATPGAAAVTDR